MTVAILDESFNPVFTGASIMDASISDTSMQQTQPVESGDEKTEYTVFNPVEVDIRLSVAGDDYVQTYREIESAYRSQEKLFFQSRVKVYGDMYLSTIPHEESSKNADGFIMSISLKEAMRPITQVKYAPASSSDATTVNRGSQRGSEATAAQEEKSSVLYRVLK